MTHSPTNLQPDDSYAVFLDELATITEDMSVALRQVAKRMRKGPPLPEEEKVIMKAYGLPRVALHIGHLDGQPCTGMCHG